MKLLGKIGIFFLFFASLYGAELRVSSSQILLGEAVRFEISANGDDIEFPNIDDIEGFSVRRTGSSYRSSSVNGKSTIKKIQSYIFYPDKDVTIPAFIVNVEGKEEYTQPLHVSIISQEKMKQKVSYSLDLHVSDKNPYVGQMIKLDMVLKIDERLRVGDLQQMGFEGLDKFWIKDKPIQTQSNENGYKIIKAEYWVSPLKDGNQSIGPVSVRIGIQSQNSDPFNTIFQRLNYKSVRSNTISLHVKPLPNGAKVAGDFTIQAIVDKKEIEAGKPVNVVVEVKGNGNLDELSSLKKDIKDVVIYEDKPKIKSEISNGIYESSWRQKLAYIGSGDFTIPPFSLKYYDAKSKEVKTIKTEPISIHVKGKVAKSIESKSEIITPAKTKVIIKKEGVNWLWILVAFVLGLSLGILFSRVTLKGFSSRKSKIFRNDKEFLQEILAYKGKNRELDGWILKLEENIYEGKKHQISKKIIENLIKDLT